MPFTPFHFGLGAAIHCVAPKRISFLAFCTANVLIDIEPLYFMLTDNPPLHRFFHTYIGATLVALATVMLFLACQRFASRFWLPDIFGWQSLSLLPVVVGAILGTYSHILLDSIMHSDIQPFSPFTHENPLLHLVSLSALHWLCIASGGLGATVLMVRKFMWRGKNAR
jgi:membrane-bound metal-dependent hydrolase YbcI (DUF457 family)